MDEQGDIQRQFCGECSRDTRHLCLCSFQRVERNDEEGFAQFSWWSIWECQGCTAIHFKYLWQFTEDIEHDGSLTNHITYYPQAGKNLAVRKEYESIPDDLDSIYGEVVDTFNNDSYILCAAGLRALLEGVCNDKLPSQSGTLRSKIDALSSLIPSNIIKHLHGFRFLGNSALHELERPNRKELALAIEVIEDILNVVYELDYKSARLYKLLEIDIQGNLSHDHDHYLPDF